MPTVKVNGDGMVYLSRVCKQAVREASKKFIKARHA